MNLRRSPPSLKYVSGAPGPKSFFFYLVLLIFIELPQSQQNMLKKTTTDTNNYKRRRGMAGESNGAGSQLTTAPYN